MILVAASSLAIAGPALLWRRAARFEATARAFRRQLEEVPFTDLELYLLSAPSNCDPEWTADQKRRFLDSETRRRDEARPLVQFQEHSSRMAEKYEWLTAHPWSSGAPDPPSPPTPSLAVRRSLRIRLDRLLDSVDANPGR